MEDTGSAGSGGVRTGAASTGAAWSETRAFLSQPAPPNATAIATPQIDAQVFVIRSEDEWTSEILSAVAYLSSTARIVVSRVAVE
jgi:hypothetical protein